MQEDRMRIDALIPTLKPWSSDDCNWDAFIESDFDNSQSSPIEDFAEPEETSTVVDTLVSIDAITFEVHPLTVDRLLEVVVELDALRTDVYGAAERVSQLLIRHESLLEHFELSLQPDHWLFKGMEGHRDR